MCDVFICVYVSIELFRAISCVFNFVVYMHTCSFLIQGTFYEPFAGLTIVIIILPAFFSISEIVPTFLKFVSFDSTVTFGMVRNLLKRSLS